MSLTPFESSLFRYGFSFVYSDGGRSTSLRDRQSSDCSVRSVVHASGLPYDLIYQILREEGRKSSQGFGMSQWLSTKSWAKPLSLQTLFDPKGLYLVNTFHHVFTLRQSQWLDTFFNRKPFEKIWSLDLVVMNMDLCSFYQKVARSR